jgi:hypothetical protein
LDALRNYALAWAVFRRVLSAPDKSGGEIGTIAVQSFAILQLTSRFDR